jgi:hypothetical protein
MARDVTAILEAAALAAFEQLAFLLPDPEPMEAVGDLMGMRVMFAGPTSGALVVRGDSVLLEALAMNMLGADEAPSEELQLDALGEMANVICGNVLPEVEDPSAVFRLSAPEPVALSSASAPGVRDAVSLAFEGGVVRVEWLEAPL